jgi:hypothetical protein
MSPDLYQKTRYERAKRLAESISYKEGWRIRALAEGNIIITWVVDDVTATHPGMKTSLGYTVGIFDEVPDDYELHEIYQAIVRMEQHEASEHFKVNGKAIFNEHVLYPYNFVYDGIREDSDAYKSVHRQEQDRDASEVPSAEVAGVPRSGDGGDKCA